MTKFLAVLTIVGQFTLAATAFADSTNLCESPSPLFGKIVATCGSEMITYVGDQQVEILGTVVTQSEFELSDCTTGGGRLGLSLETNSEGFNFKTRNDGAKNQYQISRTWGKFEMQGIDDNGNEVKVKCADYNDTRTDIEYIE